MTRNGIYYRVNFIVCFIFCFSLFLTLYKRGLLRPYKTSLIPTADMHLSTVMYVFSCRYLTFEFILNKCHHSITMRFITFKVETFQSLLKGVFTLIEDLLVISLFTVFIRVIWWCICCSLFLFAINIGTWNSYSRIESV